MSRPENPYAFPVPDTGNGFPYQEGMSLRDWFAGQALAGLLSGNPKISVADDALHDALALASYRLSDAMLVEREKGGAE